MSRLGRMSDKEYFKYCEYLEEKEDAEQWEAMYGDPCTCEWRELRYGRVCVRHLCAHCTASIAFAKRVRTVMRQAAKFDPPYAFKGH